MTDIMGNGLWSYFNGNSKAGYTIERDDRFENFNPAEKYFAEYEDWQDCERQVISRVSNGLIGDFGAGAGRHSLYLQEQGFEIWAIDISPLACKVMRKQGIEHVFCRDIFEFIPPNNRKFNCILLMYNNFGLAGTIPGAKKFLGYLSDISNDNARIIATILDPYKTKLRKHLAYHEINREKGLPGGQVKIRLKRGNQVGDWFNLLLVSPSELADICSDSDWKVSKIIGPEQNGMYGAILEKK